MTQDRQDDTTLAAPDNRELVPFVGSATPEIVKAWLINTRPRGSRVAMPTDTAIDELSHQLMPIEIKILCARAARKPNAETFGGVEWASSETILAAKRLIRLLNADAQRHEANHLAVMRSFRHLPTRFSILAEHLKTVAASVETLDSARTPKWSWHIAAREIATELDRLKSQGFCMPKSPDREGWRCRFIETALAHYDESHSREVITDAIRGRRGGHKKLLKKHSVNETTCR